MERIAFFDAKPACKTVYDLISHTVKIFTIFKAGQGDVKRPRLVGYPAKRLGVSDRGISPRHYNRVCLRLWRREVDTLTEPAQAIH